MTTDGLGVILLLMKMGGPMWVICRVGWIQERCKANVIINTGGLREWYIKYYVDG
jgi:hypothetical protein